MSRDMTDSEAIANLNHIYGVVSPDIQRSLDVAFKALEEKPTVSFAINPDYVIELQEHNKKLIKQLEEVERPQGEWIPVSERLPEEKINPYTTDFDEVLCTTDWGDVQAFKFGTPILHHKPHFWLGGAIMDEHIIAWQYKPEPYTEKKITNFYTKRFKEVN